MRLGKKGDTLVEVLLATVILSLVMAGAFTISNRATQIGQNSLERSQVSNNIQEQIEIIRAMRDGDYPSWNEIVDNWTIPNGSPDYTSCEPTNASRAFYISFNENNYPVPAGGAERFNLESADAIQLFSQNSSDAAGNVVDSKSDFFEVWIEAYAFGNEIEFHARSCWDQLGGDVRGQANTIYKLQDFR